MGKLLGLLGAYLKANLKIGMEYRVSFFSQLVGMVINDGLWVVFWMFYFNRFPVLKGWTLDDVVVLWAVMATSFGIVFGFCSNLYRFNQLVVTGQLDFYLTLPKPVLYHVAIARLAPHNLGDVVFGPLVLVLLVDMTWQRWVVYLVAVLLASCVILGFAMLVASLSFYLGSAQSVSSQLYYTLFHFTAYPPEIFQGAVKALLFTLVPAGFISGLPVELVRTFSWQTLAFMLVGAALFLSLGVTVWYRGLRRYESGNKLLMRS